MSIWAGTTGGLDDVPVGDIRRFESEFLDYIARERTGIFDAIVASNNLEDSTIEQLEERAGRLQEDLHHRPTASSWSATSRSARSRTPEARESITKHKQPPPADAAPADAPTDVASAGNTAAE